MEGDTYLEVDWCVTKSYVSDLSSHATFDAVAESHGWKKHGVAPFYTVKNVKSYTRPYTCRSYAFYPPELKIEDINLAQCLCDCRPISGSCSRGLTIFSEEECLLDIFVPANWKTCGQQRITFPMCSGKAKLSPGRNIFTWCAEEFPMFEDNDGGKFLSSDGMPFYARNQRNFSEKGQAPMYAEYNHDAPLSNWTRPWMTQERSTFLPVTRMNCLMPPSMGVSSLGNLATVMLQEDGLNSLLEKRAMRPKFAMPTVKRLILESHAVILEWNEKNDSVYLQNRDSFSRENFEVHGLYLFPFFHY